MAKALDQHSAPCCVNGTRGPTWAVQEKRSLEPVVEISTVELRRELGLVAATSLVVGMVIGSGIFISPKGVLRATGSVGLSLLVWAVAGIAQLGTALCYAELGAMIPTSGGSYTYLRMGLGNILAFMYVLQGVLVQGPASMVIMLLTFAKYTITMLPVCGSPVYLEKVIAATALVMPGLIQGRGAREVSSTSYSVSITLALVNAYSSKMASRVAVITTVGKVLALIVIIIGGFVIMAQGITGDLDTGFSGTSNEPISLALAMYSAGFSYGGGEHLNIVAEEIRHREKNLPRAAILGILLVIVIYMCTNVAYLSAMTRAELLSAEAVAVVFADRVLGAAAKLVPVAVMVSTFGSANNSLFSKSRFVFAAARDQNLPDIFSYIQVSRLTPLGGMSLTVAMSLILLAPGNVSSLMNYIGFLGSFYNSCVYVCFIIFRLRTMRDADRPIKIPLVIPILMLLLSVYLFVAPLIISPDLRYIYVAAAVLAVSALIYIPFIHFRLSVPCYDKLVTWLQLTFQVCPPSKK